MNKYVAKVILPAAAAALLATGCVLPPPPPPPPVAPMAEVAVSGAPPAPIYEVQPPLPAPGYVWVGGSWVWGPGNRWEWERGRYALPPRPGAVWVGHRYEYRGGRHVWVRGGWR